MNLNVQPIGRYLRCSVQKITSGKSHIQGRFADTSLKLADAEVLLFFTFALLAVGAAQRFLDIAHRSAFDVVVMHEVNAGELLAFVAIYVVLKSNVDAVRLTRVDLVIISACAMFFLFPKQSLPFVGATIAGIYFWRRRPYTAQLASVGQLWLAMSVYRFWGRLFFQVVCTPIIQAEVFVIAKAGQLLGFGLSVDGIPPNLIKRMVHLRYGWLFLIPQRFACGACLVISHQVGWIEGKRFEIDRACNRHFGDRLP